MRLKVAVPLTWQALLWVTLLAACAHDSPVYRPIATDDFAQSLERWNKRHPDRDITPYNATQILAVADNLLLMQRNNGGWPAHTNPFRRLSGDEKLRFLKDQNAADASFADNNVFAQIYYLSHVYLQTGDVQYRNAARRALQLVMSAQLYNGGWSLRARDSLKQREGVQTIDTQVTLDALQFLRQVAAGRMPYGYIPFTVRRQAASTVEKGDGLLLRLQLAYNSRASGWASAYDLETGQPVASANELSAAINVPLTVDVANYFANISRPPAQVLRAVKGAHDWFVANSVQRWAIRQGDNAAFTPGLVSPHSDQYVPAQSLWAKRYSVNSSEPLGNDYCPAVDTPWVEYAQELGDWPEEFMQQRYPRWRELNG